MTNAGTITNIRLETAVKILLCIRLLNVTTHVAFPGWKMMFDLAKNRSPTKNTKVKALSKTTVNVVCFLVKTLLNNLGLNTLRYLFTAVRAIICRERKASTCTKNPWTLQNSWLTGHFPTHKAEADSGIAAVEISRSFTANVTTRMFVTEWSL